jgi:hypothetical protein
MIVAVEVGVALTRPPKTDRISRVLVEVDLVGEDWFGAETEAQLIACWMVCRPDVVMPVYSKVTDILEV